MEEYSPHKIGMLKSAYLFKILQTCRICRMSGHNSRTCKIIHKHRYLTYVRNHLCILIFKPGAQERPARAWFLNYFCPDVCVCVCVCVSTPKGINN